MKRNFLCLVAFFIMMLSAVSVSAQSSFSFGVKVGVNFSNYISESNLAPGCDAGIFLRGGKRFYIQPEVCYSLRNTKFSEIIDEIKENNSLGQHFIDVPILLGYKIVNNPNFNLRFFIGPRFGFRIGSSYDNIDDLIGYAQWGGQGGIGIDFWRFTFDVKYDISGTKFKEYDNDTFWKQNMINIALGFKIVK